MSAQRTIAEWLTELGTDVERLAAESGLDGKVVEAIAAGRYTTGPAHRERIAAALGLSVADIRWGRAIGVDHMYGHGPQFGRSP